MNRRTMRDFEALSPRYRGFDPHFAHELGPLAPGLTSNAPRENGSARFKALLALSILVILATPAAIHFYPEATLPYRPWAYASCGFLLAGVLLAMCGRSARLGGGAAHVTPEIWARAVEQVASFFGLASAPTPTGADLDQSLAMAPVPTAPTFRPLTCYRGVLKHGAVAGVAVDAIAGKAGGVMGILIVLRFSEKAPGIAALLDRRISETPRTGLAPFARPTPDAAGPVDAFAENDAVAARLFAPTALQGIAAAVASLGATALNIAVVDNEARLYAVLGSAWPLADDSPPGPDSVAALLAAFDSLAIMAEAMAPVFAVGDAIESESQTA